VPAAGRKPRRVRFPTIFLQVATCCFVSLSTYFRIVDMRFYLELYSGTNSPVKQSGASSTGGRRRRISLPGERARSYPMHESLRRSVNLQIRHCLTQAFLECSPPNREDGERQGQLPTVPSMLILVLCSNRAATRVNILKCWEKCQRRNTAICRHFARSRSLQQTITLHSHSRGRWFDPSIAHSNEPRPPVR
jgi:hypothetical protein